MPEGDTLRRLATKVSERFLGQTVQSSVFRHPRLATADLSGAVLTSVDSTGKHLLCRFDNGTTMHLHLLMQGRVRFSPVLSVPEWRRRFEIRFETGIMTGVDIPLLHLIDTSREHHFTGHLGPDLCGPYDHEAAISRLSGAGEAHLSAALLDQRILAGFGNIYAVETPFICGLSPFTLVASIDDVGPIVSIGAALIRTNAARGPQNTTGRRINTPDQWVLPSRIRLCKICGTKLSRLHGSATPWQRRTAWCPRCQPESATGVDVQRATKLLGLHPARRLLSVDSLELVADTSSRVEANLPGFRK